jgi:hypothetical protein
VIRGGDLMSWGYVWRQVEGGSKGVLESAHRARLAKKKARELMFNFLK